MGSLFSMITKNNNYNYTTTTKVKEEKSSDNKTTNVSELWNSIRITSILLYFLSMLLAFTTTIQSTAAGTKLLIGGTIDGIYKTKNAWDFLLHSYEYDFICIRWSFLTSLMCFLLAMTGRTILEFNLLSLEKTKLLALLLLGMMALISFSLSFINTTMFSSKSTSSDNNALLFGMTRKVVKMEYQRGMKSQHAFEMVSLLSVIGAFIVLIKIILWDFVIRKILQKNNTPLKSKNRCNNRNNDDREKRQPNKGSRRNNILDGKRKFADHYIGPYP
mmetsp:Transcript_3770/g.4348  ORF Transcript_3770/g.4348 Transcript_3770/m.4348 type:complete len:274 (-) Transcript_3770:52-873(-)